MESPSEREKSKFDFRTFSIMVLIAVVPMLVGTWYLFAGYEDAYLEMAGANLSGIAESAYALLNSYLQDNVIQMATMTEVPDLRAAIAGGNADLQKNLEEVRKAIPKMADAWAGGDRRSTLEKSVLENTASQFLRRYSAMSPSFREIMVTDFFGRLVAATGKTDKYYFAHEDWWKETYGDGRRGLVYIGDAAWNEAAKSYCMDMAQPFVDESRGVIGTIRVILDLQGVHSRVGSLQAGPGQSVELIHARGDVISAPGYSSLQRTTYPATLDILNAREKGKRYFLSSQQPSNMYGLPQRSFQATYPHLNWIVVATGKVADLRGPIPQLRKYFIALVVGMLLLAFIATLMLSRVEARPVLEQDPHLEKL